MFKLHPDWGSGGQGVRAAHGGRERSLYLYYVVGLVGAGMTPYEVYFYSSGGVEERYLQRLGHEPTERIVGYCLGAVLSFALLICAGALFLPRGISPELLGGVALARAGRRSGRSGSS